MLTNIFDTIKCFSIPLHINMCAVRSHACMYSCNFGLGLTNYVLSFSVSMVSTDRSMDPFICGMRETGAYFLSCQIDDFDLLEIVCVIKLLFL
jgi:hypothetical protein